MHIFTLSSHCSGNRTLKAPRWRLGARGEASAVMQGEVTVTLEKWGQGRWVEVGLPWGQSRKATLGTPGDMRTALRLEQPSDCSVVYGPGLDA